MSRYLLTRRKQDHSALVTTAVVAGAFLAVRTGVRLARRIHFRGKTVLITGGSRGLGLVMARLFAEEGANVAICARDEDELNRARADLRHYGVDVLAVQCDVTSQPQVQGMIEGVTRHFGGIDVLVNNAGTIAVGPMEVMTLKDYQEAMDTHFWAPLYTTLAVLPQMKRRQAGRIVNISSIGGKISVPHLLPYSASKFALVGFSEGLRSELMKDNIYVTTVCPGLMRTGSPRNAQFKGQHQKEYAWFATSDALPLASIDARRAAARVIRACRNGEAEVMLSVQSRLACTFHGVFPGITSEINAMVNATMPEPGGIGTGRALGIESRQLVPEPVKAINDRAAAANNEVR